MTWLKNMILRLLGRRPEPVGHASLVEAVRQARGRSNGPVVNPFERN